MRKYVYLEARNQSVIRQVEIDRAAALGTTRGTSLAHVRLAISSVRDIGTDG